MGSQRPELASEASVASSLPFAELPGFSSQFSSEFPAPLIEDPWKRIVACLAWQAITPLTALAKALAILLEHLKWLNVFDTQPVSSVAHEVVPPALQSTRSPGPGGMAHARVTPNRVAPATVVTIRIIGDPPSVVTSRPTPAQRQ